MTEEYLAHVTTEGRGGLFEALLTSRIGILVAHIHRRDGRDCKLDERNRTWGGGVLQPRTIYGP